MGLDSLWHKRGWGLLFARVVAGLILLLAGWSKVADSVTMFTGMLSGMGFPAAAALAWLVAIIELVGGALIIIGLFTRWSSLFNGIIMLVATLVLWPDGGFQGAQLPLLLLAVLVVFLFQGDGKYALGDVLFKKK